MTTAATRELPLRQRTPDSWAERALADPLKLLNDHAHLEKKAATNALDLLPRWPQREPPRRWVRVMTSVARDEVSHLATVVKRLEARGGAMSRAHTSSYARKLHELVRLGKGPDELVDRVLISALIEARSCERFEILSRMCKDEDLAKLYRSLWSSEHGHYHVFVEVAGMVKGEEQARERFADLLDREAEIIKLQPSGPSIHSW